MRLNGVICVITPCISLGAKYQNLEEHAASVWKRHYSNAGYCPFSEVISYCH